MPKSLPTTRQYSFNTTTPSISLLREVMAVYNVELFKTPRPEVRGKYRPAYLASFIDSIRHNEKETFAVINDIYCRHHLPIKGLKSHLSFEFINAEVK